MSTAILKTHILRALTNGFHMHPIKSHQYHLQLRSQCDKDFRAEGSGQSLSIGFYKGLHKGLQGARSRGAYGFCSLDGSDTEKMKTSKSPLIHYEHSLKWSQNSTSSALNLGEGASAHGVCYVRAWSTLLGGFMGSYKWGYKSPNMGYKYIVTLLITPLITTHEPPSGKRKHHLGTIIPEAEARLWRFGFGGFWVEGAACT